MRIAFGTARRTTGPNRIKVSSQFLSLRKLTNDALQVNVNRDNLKVNLAVLAMARRLHDHWTSRADSLAPGGEYELVDEFAEMLGIRGWFDWNPDVG